MSEGRCWFFHQWGKWKQYETKMVGVGEWNKGQTWNEIWQRRTCERCGYMQEELV